MKDRFSEKRSGKFDDGPLKGQFGLKKDWFSKVVLTQVLFVFLFLPILGAFAGTDEALEKLKRQDIERALKYEKLKDAKVPGPIRGVTPRTLPVDTDDDGMPDSWELANGLDPNNPDDAWFDPDGDEVVNLFEYQLGSDLNNPATPPVATVPGDYPDVETAIDSVADGTAIRVAGGSYNVNYITFSTKVVMIQGGWSADFSQRDLSLYPTTFDGRMQDEILYFSPDSGESAIILDGLHFVRGWGYFGAVNLLAWGSAFMTTSIFNCSITESGSGAYYGAVLRMNNWDTSESDRTIANTLIAGNEASGSYNQITEYTTARWRIINTTISQNLNGGGDNGYGIEAFTLDNGVLTAHIYNSIIWGNEQEDISIRRNITFEVDYSDIGNVIAEFGAIYLPGDGVVNVDPLFVDPPSGDFHLQDSSPLIGAGINEGIPRIDIEGNPRPNPPGSITDIGAYENPLGELEWPKVYDLIFKRVDSEAALPLLRRYRDFILMADPQGEKLVRQLYEEHSSELAIILLTHPKLALRGASMIRENLPGLAMVLGGGQMEMSQPQLARVEILLEDVSNLGSLRLKDYIQSVKQILQKEHLVHFGVTVK